MKAQLRRILAYVIARVVSDVESNTLYDYQELSYFNFNGTITDKSVKVQDYSDALYLKGSIKRIDLGFQLTVNDGSGNSITIMIKSKASPEGHSEFVGTGRGQSMSFHGVAEQDGKVSFYDSSTGMYYRLKI